MTAPTDFDGAVASWLQGPGPTFVRNEVVEEALVRAHRIGRRRGLAALVFGPAAWPSHRSRLLFAGLPPVVRLAMLVALTLSALVGVAAVGAQLLRQLSPPAYRGGFVPAADMAFGRTNAVVVPLDVATLGRAARRRADAAPSGPRAAPRRRPPGRDRRRGLPARTMRMRPSGSATAGNGQ